MRRFKTEIFFFLGGLVILGILFVLQYATLLPNGSSHFVSLIGVPLDDVYIHCRYAENLLNGNGYCFNPGAMVTADTSPLWVILIACGGLFTSHLDLVAVLLSSLAWLAIAPGVYRFAKNVLGFEEPWAIIAGILTLLSARLIAAAPSGMETTLATLLTLVAVEIHIRSRDVGRVRFREAIVLGLAISLRPELYFLAALCSVDWLILFIRKRVSFAGIVVFAGILILFIVAVFGLPYSERGSFIYHSSIVQGAGFRLVPDFFYILKSYGIIIESYWWLAVMILGDVVKLHIPKIKARHAVMIGFVLLLPIMQGFIAPQYRHFGRYVFPLLPLFVLSVTAFLRKNILAKNNNWSDNFFGFQNSPQKKGKALIVVVVILLLPMSVRWALQYRDCVSNIYDQHVTSAEWVKNNLNANDVIAADDVGALGYFTKRTIIDLTGLVTPGIFTLQHDQKLVWKAARDSGANIFIIYRRLNPAFFEYAKDSLELVRNLRISGNLTSSADTVLSIYRMKGATHATP